MKQTKQLYIYWGLFAVFIAYVLIVSVLYLTPYARSWDQVDFALALATYDLYQMQPHFPGYPYFILGGMFFSHFVDNPVQALSLLNTVLMATAIIPIFLLLKKMVDLRSSLLITAVIYSMSYMWVMATDPMSEPAAVAVLWGFIWSLRQAREKVSFLWNVLPLLLFSILMGIRLSYAPFGIGILLLWYSYRTYFATWGAYIKFLLGQGILATLFQLIWIAGLIVSTGGAAAFFELAIGFTGGHFSEWGGAVTTDSMPFIDRFVYLVFYDFLWIGLFAQSLPIAFLYVLFSVLFIVQFKRQKWKTDTFTYWIIIMWGAYFFWVLFAQNVDKPRHILPLTGLFVFFVLKIVLKFNFKKQKFVYGMCIILILLQCIHGSHLIMEKANEPPAVYQLHDYLAEIDEPIMVFTWEESRVMEYLQAPYNHQEIFTYAYFQSQLPSNPQVKVYITDRVVEGFKNQGYPVQPMIKKVERFHSNPLFDPVYGTITLYEWVGN